MSDQREYGPAAYVNIAGVEIGYYPTIRADEVHVTDRVVLDREAVRIDATGKYDNGDAGLGSINGGLGSTWFRRLPGNMVPLVSVEPVRGI